MTLPGQDAVNRLIENEARFDSFLNAEGSYTTRLGATVETVPSLMERLQDRYLSILDRGLWATSTVYAINDVVKQNTYVYICVEGHTSGVFNTDLTNNKWALYQFRSSEIESVKDFGAIGNDAGDELTAINAALVDPIKHILLPTGEYRVSANPTNIYGNQFLGNGVIKKPITGGYQQLNSYADEVFEYGFGREYLWKFLNDIKNYKTVNTIVQVYGDSTIAGSNQTTPYLVQNLIPYLYRIKGIPSSIQIANFGVSGTSIGSLDAISHGGSDRSLIIIKYGINDGYLSQHPMETRLNTFATTLRAKLAEYRASYPVVGTNSASVLLVGPNSTSDTPFGRDEYWYEQLRGIYIQAARDYKCAYFDTYAFLKDARGFAGTSFDDPYGDGRAIHPGDLMHAQIWGGIFDWIIGPSDTPYYKTNVFQNVRNSQLNNILATTLPNTFPIGISWYRATVANGWPIDGYVETHRHADDIVWQRLISYNDAKTFGNQTITRCSSSNLGAWETWSGYKYAITSFQNSWQVYSGGTAWVARDSDGFVTVGGLISSGTTAVNTTLLTLPNNWAPSNTEYFAVPCSTGPVMVSLDTGGAIKAQSVLSATWTSLSGIKFLAK